MRSYIPTLAVLLFIISLSTTITAFPHYARDVGVRLDANVNISDPNVVAGINRIVASLLAPSTCNSTYKVDHVRYPFLAPGPNDKRGPCPGLNSLANHGYLPRNGIVNAVQLRDACRCIVNLDNGLTLGLIIAGYLTTADLAIDQGSIGGPGATTKNVGMCHHTGIEKDASLVGTDVGLGGNCKVNLTLWNLLKTYAENGTTPWDVKSLADINYLRYNQSKTNNPTFTWQAFPFVTAFTATGLAYYKFSEGLPARNTPSQASWWVYNRIPTSFVDKGASVGTAQTAPLGLQFIALHQDPLWIANVQIPSNRDCYDCWWRFLLEDTFLGFGNLLYLLYDSMASYGPCTTSGC